MLHRFVDRSGHGGLRQRGTTERRGETFNLGIRLDLEILSYKLLMKASLLHRASAISCCRQRDHEFFRRVS